VTTFSALRTQARASGGGYLLTGRKNFVLDGAVEVMLGTPAEHRELAAGYLIDAATDDRSQATGLRYSP